LAQSAPKKKPADAPKTKQPKQATTTIITTSPSLYYSAEKLSHTA
jgi:hypothetical protein